MKRYNVKLGFMSFFLKAATQALLEFPIVNSVIDGNEIVRRNFVDISVAVATPTGLLVPVLRNCHNMKFHDFELVQIILLRDLPISPKKEKKERSLLKICKEEPLLFQMVELLAPLWVHLSSMLLRAPSSECTQLSTGQSLEETRLLLGLWCTWLWPTTTDSWMVKMQFFSWREFRIWSKTPRGCFSKSDWIKALF